MKRLQYTIRQVPEALDRALRQRSEHDGASLNETVLNVLARGSGLANEPMRFHDLDDLAGTWVEDSKFDEAIRAQDRVDARMWR